MTGARCCGWAFLTPGPGRVLPIVVGCVDTGTHSPDVGASTEQVIQLDLGWHWTYLSRSPPYRCLREADRGAGSGGGHRDRRHRVSAGVGDVGGCAIGVIAIPARPVPRGIGVPGGLSCVGGKQTRFPGVLLRSEGVGEFNEDRSEPMSSVDIHAECVMAASVLDERVPGTDHPCRAQSLQAAHRP
jgi:hypothetical protein